MANPLKIRLRSTSGLSISTSAALTGTTGVAFSVVLTANAPVETWTLLSGSNFSLDGATLSLINVAAAGTSAATVRATDYTGRTATKSITVTLSGAAGLGQVANLSISSTTASTIVVAYDSLAGATSYQFVVDGDVNGAKTLGVNNTIGVARPGSDYSVQVRGKNSTDTGALSTAAVAAVPALSDPGPAAVQQAARAIDVTNAMVPQLNLNYASAAYPFMYYGNSTGTLTDGTFVAGGWVKDILEPLVNLGVTSYRSLPAGHQSATHQGSVIARNLYDTYGVKQHATLNYNTYASTSVAVVLENIRNTSKGNFARAIASFAGLNEPNDASKTAEYTAAGTTWQAETIAHTIAIKDGIIAGGADYANVEHYAYSPWGRRGMADLLAYTDGSGRTWQNNCAPYIAKLNLHYYTGGRRPDVAGAPTGAEEGGTTLSEVSIDWTIDDYNVLAPTGTTLPLVCTESGWGRLNVDTTVPYVSLDTARKYQQRLVFVNLLRSIPITVWFQLFQTDTTMNWQMVNFSVSGGVATFTPTTLYTIFKNTLEAFYDNGATAATFTPGTLNFTLSADAGAPNDYDQQIQHKLFQKSNGDFYLAIWYEKDSWQRSTKTETFGSRTVKLTLGSAATVSTNRPYTNNTFTSLGSLTTTNLTVHDDVLVVKVVP